MFKTFVTELVLCINRKTSSPGSKSYDKFLRFSLSLLQLTAVQKTFTLGATIRLGAVNLQHFRTGQKVLQIIEMLNDPIESTESEDFLEKDDSIMSIGNQYLFTVTYSNVSTYMYL